MKKLIIALSLLSNTAFSQYSETRIINTINDSIRTNGSRAITGSILNAVLKDMNISYYNKITDTLPSAGTVTELDPVISILNTLPSSPTSGNRYLVGTAPVAGHANEVAEWNGSSYNYTVPVEDNVIYVTSTALTYRFNGTSWVVYPYPQTIAQNGNSFSVPVRIGSKNNKDVIIKRNDITQATFGSSSTAFTNTIVATYTLSPSDSSQSVPYTKWVKEIIAGAELLTEASGYIYPTTTSNNISIGKSTNGARLDIRAKGTLSTDTILRIKDSTNTSDLTFIKSDGTFRIGGTTSLTNGVSYTGAGSLFLAKDGSNFVELNPGTTNNRLFGGNHGWEVSTSSASKAIWLYTPSTNLMLYGGSMQLTSGLNVDGGATNTMFIQSGTAPTTDVTDNFKFYGKDITAGNVAPHFRTEAGNIIKLYKGAAVTTAQGLANFLADSLGLLASSTIASPTVTSVTSLSVTGTGGNGFINLQTQSSDPGAPTNGTLIFSNSNNKFSWRGSANNYVKTFDGSAATADRIYSLPDAAGTVTVLGNSSTGTGSVVLNIAPTFNTSITAPVILGGTGTVSAVTIQSTSGIGSGTANGVIFKVGDNGSIMAGTINNNGTWNIGASSPVAASSLTLNKTITGGASAAAIYSKGVIQSDVTSSARYFTTETGIATGTAAANLYHYDTFSNAFVGTVTNQYGFNADASLTGAGTINAGFRGGIAAATGRWNLYMVGTAQNYLAGNLGIGVTAPAALIDMKAGTPTAGTAPLHFTAGTNLTTAVAGTMEYDGTNLFFSPSTTRHQVATGLTGTATLDFGNLVSIGCEDLTITVTGAAVGDPVSLGIPAASVPDANWYYPSSWVSATNTVTVRGCTLVSGNPASGSFKVTVFKN